MKWTKLISLMMVGLTGALLLAACGSDPTPTPRPTATPTPAPEATPTSAPAAATAIPPKNTPTPDPMVAFEAEKAALLKAAQEEGELQAFFCCGLGTGMGDVIGEFEDKYDIEVTFSGGSSREQAPKVLAEREAGRYTLDFWSGGLNPAIPTLLPNGVLTPLKPLLFFPEVLDESLWYQDRLHWFDEGKEYVLGWTGSGGTTGIDYNTELLTDPTIIQSNWDLLDPFWKGKIIARDPREVGTSSTTAYYWMNEERGPVFLWRFWTEMDVTLTSSARQAAEQLALGKYYLCMWSCGRDVRNLKREGQPVEDVFPHLLKEGASMSPGGGTIYVMDSPPNPNAQKFFANWFFSREGQMLAQRASEAQSLRNDIPLDGVEPSAIRVPDYPYLVIGSQEGYTETLEEAMEHTRNALASVGK
jgi:ABC-type Fe3+ transport system substrate-binding protein